MTHIINGMAGNIESHSTLDAGQSTLPITAVLDFEHYGFNKVQFINETAMSFSFIQGGDGTVGDKLTLLKREPTSSASSSSTSPSSLSTGPTSASLITSVTGTSLTASDGVTYTTEIVTAYTTYCPSPTTVTYGSSTYTVTEASLYKGTTIL